MSEQQRLSSGTDSALTGKDFYDMSGPDLLAYCGDDGSKWAEAFCRIKEVQGWSAADIDQGLMIGWFANVIEHSHQVRGVAQNQKTRCENCNLLSHCGDPLCPNVGVAQRPFYGAECPSYPDCNGGCGLGCTKEIERSRGLAQCSPDRDQIALDAAYQIEALPNDLHEAQKTARVQLIVLSALYAVPPSPVAVEHAAIIDRITNITTWLREPDSIEEASLEWLMDWMDRRPIAELAMVAMLMPGPVVSSQAGVSHER